MARKLITGLLATLPVLYGIGPQVAVAQELETIVVTAQKRTQSLQDVPLSVSAYSAKYLEEFGMKNFDDIAIPGVHIGTGARNESLYVRGVGSGTNWGFEQSVPVYIDGAYYGRARAENLGFMDVERIEVLKGPQPTYFGQNAIAGAVSITTARPTKELFGYVDAAYETNSREKTLAAAISGPFSEAFRARAAFKSRDSDGWMTNVAHNNERVPQKNDKSMRLSAEMDFSKTFKAYVKYETSDEKQYGRNRQLMKCGLVNKTPTIGNFIDRTATSPEDCQFNDTLASSIAQTLHPHIPLEGGWGYIQKMKYDGGQVALDWDLNGYHLSSITSSYKLDFRVPQNDVDGSSKEITIIANTDISNQVSQEFRILSPQGGAFEWIAGTYFDHGDLDTSGTGDLYPLGSIGAAGLAVYSTAQQTAKSWSIFGEARFKLSDLWTGKLGGRQSEVKKSTVLAFRSQQINPGGVLLSTPYLLPSGAVQFPAFNYPHSRTDSSFQPAATLEYRPAKDVMTYASVKKGFKAGGYDHDTLSIPGGPGGSLTFSPETVKSYEAGFRSKLMGGKATFNATAFRSDYTDLQVSVFAGTLGFNTANAAKARTQGLEFDGALAVSNNLTLKGAMTFLDAKYLSFPGAACNPIQAVAAPPPPAPRCTQDLSSKQLQFAPKWSGNLGATLKFPVGSMKGTAQVDVFFTDEFRTSNAQDPNTIQSAFSKIDMRFGLAPASGNWEVALVGRNLTDKYTSHWIDGAVFGGGAPGLAYQIFLDRPRQIELQAKYHF